MYLLYLDESGVPETHPSQTSHYILFGLSVYEGTWFALDSQVRGVKGRYARGDLREFELHAAWIRRPYWEQERIPNFGELGTEARYEAVREIREHQRENEWPGMPGRKRRRQRRYFRYTDPYIHLTLDEREQLLDDALGIVGGYRRGVTLFAEAIDKSYLNPGTDPVDQAFTQVVTRFEAFLHRRREKRDWGILAVDHDEHKAQRLANMLRRFQQHGSPWRDIDRVIEAPFFFESEASSGVQVTDLCAYALRRYLENGERERFEIIFEMFDRTGTGLHGLRHYTNPGCDCIICREREHV